MRVLPLLLLAILGTPATAQPAKIGDRAGNLTFKDIHFLPRSLNDFKDKKAFVIVFSTTSCPLAQRYWPALSRLEKEYRPRQAQFLALNVGEDDSIPAVAAQ